MERYEIEVVENATNASNIMPETPLDKVVGDCMKDYLEHRKAEEQGLLLRLPCKVGDTVYWVYDCCMIREVIVYGFRVTPSKILMLDYSQFPFGNIGVDVFLTKEEAEQALADMKGV